MIVYISKKYFSCLRYMKGLIPKMLNLILSTLSYGVQSGVNKYFSTRYSGRKSLLQSEQCVIFATILLALFGNVQPIGGCIGYAAVYGAVYFGTLLSLIRAMALGTVGFAVIIGSMGHLLASLYGVLIFHDSWNFYTIAGIAAMIAVLILSAPSVQNDGHSDRRWYFFALLGALGNATLSILKKTMTAEYPEMRSTTFLCWGFLFAAIVGALLLIPLRREVVECYRTPLFTLGCGLFAGAGTAFGNLFLMLALADGLSTAIVFPVNVGMVSLLLWAISWLVYREVQPNRKTIAALVCCLLGVVLIAQ